MNTCEQCGITGDVPEREYGLLCNSCHYREQEVRRLESRQVRRLQRVVTPRAKRVETGALRINDDWTGLFIRGDDAIGYAQALKQAEQIVKRARGEDLGWHVLHRLRELQRLMMSVDEREHAG